MDINFLFSFSGIKESNHAKSHAQTGPRRQHAGFHQTATGWFRRKKNKRNTTQKNKKTTPQMSFL
jgi:hypothetical protein